MHQCGGRKSRSVFRASGFFHSIYIGEPDRSNLVGAFISRYELSKHLAVQSPINVGDTLICEKIMTHDTINEKYFTDTENLSYTIFITLLSFAPSLC